MATQKLILGGAAIVIVAAGGWYAFGRSNAAPAAPADTAAAATAFTGSVADLSARGGDWKCVVESQADTAAGEAPSSGTVYVSGNRIRADFTSTVPSYGTVESHLVADDTDSYSWSSMMPFGIKASRAGEETSAEPSENDPANARYTYQCAPWQADADSFVPPADVTFRTF